ncbi:helix-turn-helix domain-containing protein [Leucobacter sp. HNU]|uniref:helix-turn-helix domain-containing protein n=1 Tax=Leucobacter sp. HNU TaxID=3236805 RepID=UPI003A8051FF
MDDVGGTGETWGSFARELGLALRRRRSELRLTQEQVAEYAEIALYSYQLYERGTGTNGQPTNPRLATLLAICQVLEVPVEELLPSIPQLARPRA